MALAFQAIMWKKYQKRNKHIESSIIYASLLIITSSLLIIIIPLAFLCHLPSLLLLCLLFSRPSTFFLLLSYLILGTVVRCREGDWQLDLSLDLELLLSSKTIIKGGGLQLTSKIAISGCCDLKFYTQVYFSMENFFRECEGYILWSPKWHTHIL